MAKPDVKITSKQEIIDITAQKKKQWEDYQQFNEESEKIKAQIRKELGIII